MKEYIAVDIGASSGRLIHGVIQEDKLKLKEIHRFDNGFQKVNHHDRWNIDALIREIFIGLEKAKVNGIEQAYLGIDTWAVDYVLVGENGEKIADPISYRDKRTQNKMEELTSLLPREEIYQKTGIQFLELNTLYQLYAEDKELLKRSDKILFIPDYIGYVLTGNQVTEVTNASTSQMLNLESSLFDKDLMESVGVTSDSFAPLVDPGTSLGYVLEKWKDHYDIPDIEVVSVASHDTASAVVGTPATLENDWAYLSSGTWSLIGIESAIPINSKAAYQYNFTNEWGAYNTYRFLKNIMGLWMVQEIRRLHSKELSFSEIAKEADKVEYFTSVIDVNDNRFSNPEDMISEIKNACRETNQPVPETIGELANCIYSSLAKCYEKELKHIEEITEKKIEYLYIVGGGANVDTLNQLTANLAKKVVYAGPDEATAIGNILVQMISTDEIRDLSKGRQLVDRSFNIRQFVPK